MNEGSDFAPESRLAVVRDFRESDVRDLVEIYQASVHGVDGKFYSAREREAWAPSPPDYDDWRDRLAGTPPFVAELDGRSIGFMTLLPEGHIHWTYVHPEFQGSGIATLLYDFLENQARERGMHRLTVDASHVARPVFERFGFEVVRRNEVPRNGVLLASWRMAKSLA